MKALKITPLIFLILLLLFFGGLALLGLSGQSEALPFVPSPTPAPPSVEPLPELSLRADSAEAERLDRAYAQVWAYTLAGDCVSDGERAHQPLTLTLLDADAFAGAGLREELIARLSQRVALARHADEIYDSEGHFYPELLREIYEEILTERLAHPHDYTLQRQITLNYRYTEAGWVLENEEEIYPLRPDPEALYAAARLELPYLPLRFSLDEQALCGMVPDESKFVFTEDPAVIAALLERPEAKALIGDEKLVWNSELPFVPGTLIRCYLDESILCIVWQEPEVSCMGTFAEVFISDGSQLRRKISSDEPWSLWFERTTDFARKANAVLAVGGDFYYHGRNCGVSVYNREIIRFRPDNADTCFITADGDMLFLYRGAGLSQEETEQYLQENDVVFSLAFGPVLIDEGVDVTPEAYPWGEVNDYYARSALGLLGRHHYLTMNINCDTTRRELDHLPSLRHAADAMIRRGCRKAYTLDGGQTATTVFHYELINPVQFGKEKEISDIIYFATAVPEE